jgi:hypothetical protein
VFFKERNDAKLQISDGTHREPVRCFPVIVASVIATDLSAPEEPLQEVTHPYTLLSLDHGERRLDLPASATRSVAKDWNAEAAFAVDEADDPLRET